VNSAIFVNNTQPYAVPTRLKTAVFWAADATGESNETDTSSLCGVGSRTHTERERSSSLGGHNLDDAQCSAAWAMASPRGEAIVANQAELYVVNTIYVDNDADGQITFEEFKAACTSGLMTDAAVTMSEECTDTPSITLSIRYFLPSWVRSLLVAPRTGIFLEAAILSRMRSPVILSH
jgi:hypothetical protein